MFIFCLFFRYTERRGREDNLLMLDSLPKSLQCLQLSLCTSGARRLFWVCHVSADSQGFAWYWTAFAGSWMGSRTLGLEVSSCYNSFAADFITQWNSYATQTLLIHYISVVSVVVFPFSSLMLSI